MNKNKIRIVAILIVGILLFTNFPIHTISKMPYMAGNVGGVFPNRADMETLASRSDAQAPVSFGYVTFQSQIEKYTEQKENAKQKGSAEEKDNTEQSENADIAGLQIEIFSDAACESSVGKMVFSFDGRCYEDFANQVVVFQTATELEACTDKQIRYFYLPEGTYYYRLLTTYYQTEDEVKTIWNKGGKEIVAFVVDKKYDRKENAEIVEPDFVWNVQSEDKSSGVTQNEAAQPEETSPDVTQNEAAQPEVTQNEAVQPEEASSDVTQNETVQPTKRISCIGVFETIMSMPVLLSTAVADTTQYRLGRMKAETSCKDYRLLQYDVAGKYQKLFSVYCGDKDADMPWYAETSTDGIRRMGTQAVVYSDDTEDSYQHNGGTLLNENIRKVLYQGYKNKASQTVIQNNLNEIRHHGKNMGGTVPFTRQQAEIKIGEKLPTPVKTDISPAAGENRYQYTYNMAIQDTAFVSSNTPEETKQKRTKVQIVTGGGDNSFEIKVPDKSGVTLWVCTNWNQSIKETKWKSYQPGKTAKLKPGNRFFFTANLNVSGNTNIPVTDAKQDGFTAYAVKPDNKDIQMCFAGALYQYTLKISIDWGESLIEGKFTIKKEPANAEAVSLPADTDYYNMAGIRYTVYLDKKCTEKIGANIVLSYDGIAYQDKDGANIVFDCAAAKQHYTDTYGKKPEIYYWTRQELEDETIYTYYFRERETIYSGDGTAKWYAKKGTAYGYFEKQTCPYASALMKQTGYCIDTTVRQYTLGKDKKYTVTSSVPEPYETGSLGLKKTYDGKTEDLKGLRFDLYKVKNKQTSYTDKENAVKIGEYTVNSKGFGIPVLLTKKAAELGVKSDYKNEDIDKAACRQFYNLPLGWYVIVEDAAVAGAKGFQPADAVYYEVTASNADYEFNIRNQKGSLCLKKTSDTPEITGENGNNASYNIAGAQYKVYKVSYNGDETTNNYIGTFQTEQSGMAHVTDVNRSSGYYLSDKENAYYYSIAGLPLNNWYYIIETGSKEEWQENALAIAKGYLINKSEKEKPSYYKKWIYLDSEKQVVTDVYLMQNQEKAVELKETPATAAVQISKSGEEEFGIKLPDYSVAGIKYKLYMDTTDKSGSGNDASKYVCTFEIDENGKGIVSDINSAFVPTEGNGSIVVPEKKDAYTISGLPLGAYYFVEISGNDYFEQDKEIKRVALTEENAKDTDSDGFLYEFELKDTAKTGDLSLEKRSAEPQMTDHNSAYSLEGAVYNVYMVAGENQTYKEENKVGTFTTALLDAEVNMDMKTEADAEPDTKTEPDIETNSDMHAEVDSKADTDIETTDKVAAGIPEIDNSCEKENHFQTIDGSLAEIAVDLNNNCFTQLPFGWYAVVEVEASKGFALDTTVHYKHIAPESASGGVHQKVSSVEQVKRGNVVFEKANADSKERMAGVAFRISLLGDDGSKTESHIVVTDENGKFDSGKMINVSTEMEQSERMEVNRNDAVYQFNCEQNRNEWQEYLANQNIWFYGYSGGGTAVTKEKFAMGALPYGNYLIEEIPCTANEGFIIMEQQTFQIQGDSTINLGTYLNEATTETTIEQTTETTTELTTEITTESTTEVTTKSTTEVTTEQTTEVTTEFTTDTTTETITEDSPGPKTGDNANLFLAYVGFFAATAGTLVLSYKKKKR